MKNFGYLIILLLLFSCQKESVKTPALLIDAIPGTKYYQTEIFSADNLKLYGKWQFLYVYNDAGIAGGPGKVNATYDCLEIKEYGVYGMVKDNKLIETGKIEIIKQENFQLEIKLNPDIKDDKTNSPEYYYVTYKNDSIIMTDASIGCGVLFNAYKRYDMNEH